MWINSEGTPANSGNHLGLERGRERERGRDREGGREKGGGRERERKRDAQGDVIACVGEVRV
jgi:hypothetical protein